MLSPALASDVAAGASWGVPDSTFLVAYAVVGVVAVLAAQVWRLLVVGVPGAENEPRPLTAVEVGMIEGGPQLAVSAALNELRGRGLLGIDDRVTRGVSDADELDEFVRAVHEYVRIHDGFATETDLLRDSTVLRRIRRMRLDLVGRGLLITDERRHLIMWSVSPVVVLEVVGALRLAADVADGRGAAGLVIVMAVLLAIGLGILFTVPNRTPAGDAATHAVRH